MIAPPPLPPGRWVRLGRRGRPWVWDTGPAPGRPTVVLLHGLGATAALNWCRCFGPLAERFRVVAMDHRGHGRGMRSPVFSLEECADDTAALIDEVGTGPAIVAGYSMGGPIGLHLWRRHPEAVAGLVLCATAAGFHAGTIPGPAIQALALGASFTWALLPPAARARVAAAGRREAPAQPAAPELPGWALQEAGTASPVTLIQAAGALAAFDASAWLPEVDRPAAVVVTTRDRIVSPARQWTLARRIPDALALPIEADHRACVEAPDVFVPALLEGCAAVAGPAA